MEIAPTPLVADTANPADSVVGTPLPTLAVITAPVVVLIIAAASPTVAVPITGAIAGTPGMGITLLTEDTATAPVIRLFNPNGGIVPAIAVTFTDVDRFNANAREPTPVIAVAANAVAPYVTPVNTAVAVATAGDIDGETLEAD
jgi:hypothetical protein